MTEKKGKKKVRLSRDPRNAREHPQRNLDAVERSLSELGAGRSIVVDKDGVVIGGNAVYEKALKLGLPMRVVHTNGDQLAVVVRDDLSTDDERRKALALADNQIATLAEWDDMGLVQLLGEIEEVSFEAMGFGAMPDMEIKGDGSEPSTETGNKCPRCGYEW